MNPRIEPGRVDPNEVHAASETATRDLQGYRPRKCRKQRGEQRVCPPQVGDTSSTSRETPRILRKFGGRCWTFRANFVGLFEQDIRYGLLPKPPAPLLDLRDHATDLMEEESDRVSFSTRVQEAIG
ncbi:hypothetical protein E2320_013921 [Naja naja]|nr:hypothetical protein E2320_013921 [Naja naja]